MADKPVCIVTGVGPGTGSAIARRFAKEGYNVAMMARREDRLTTIAQENPGTHSFPCDVTDLDAMHATIEQIRTDLGTPEVLVHNAVGGAFGDFMEADPDMLQQNFDVNVMALMHLARAVAPAMIEAGRGAIMATGNTAARRGKAHFAAFAPTKAAQRILMESMARRLGPDGIHVGYVMIDAVIDLKWTRKRYAGKPDGFFCKPDAIAQVVWDLVQQDRSAWAFDVEIRPYGETW